MAVDAFINIQLSSLHIKEPYIVYPSYLRIQKALGECLENASPHAFQPSNNSEIGRTMLPTADCEDNVSIKITRGVATLRVLHGASELLPLPLLTKSVTVFQVQKNI